MKRKYLLFYLIICMVSLICCNKINNSVSEEIAKKVSDGEGAIINIANLTNFEWDKLYIFDPYESRDNIQNTIGQVFLKANDIHISVSEEVTLLVFTKDGNVVHYFNHPRRKGDFSGFKDHDWFTPENSKFKVVHKGYSLYGKWPKLVITK